LVVASSACIGYSSAVPTMHRTIVALVLGTGKEPWKFAINSASASLRGLNYWPGDKGHPATIFAVVKTVKCRYLAQNWHIGVFCTHSEGAPLPE